jgi:hypothetical protein
VLTAEKPASLQCALYITSWHIQEAQPCVCS